MPGKIDAPLNKKLASVKWGEYNLEQMFGKSTRGKRLKSTDRITGKLPFVTAGEINEGISAYIDNDVEIFSENTITIDMFGSAKYRNYSYGADDHITVVHTEKLSKFASVFITAAIHKVSHCGQFDYSKNFYAKDADALNIFLPVKNNEIDFEFMEDFVAELHAERVAELAERVAELHAYLSAAKFNTQKQKSSKQANISLDEKLASVNWNEYKIGDLFEKIKTNSLKYKTSDLPDTPSGEFTLPALTAGIRNQGLNNYVPRTGATILKNVISISANGNAGTTFYQNREFTVLQDAYAIKWQSEDIFLSDNQYLFLAGSISKAIYDKYEWTNKAGWKKVKNDTIKLPTKNNEIDFEFMEDFVAELQVEHISVLQTEYATELQTYLSVTGLNQLDI